MECRGLTPATDASRVRTNARLSSLGRRAFGSGQILVEVNNQRAELEVMLTLCEGGVPGVVRYTC